MKNLHLDSSHRRKNMKEKKNHFSKSEKPAASSRGPGLPDARERVNDWGDLNASPANGQPPHSPS